MQPNKYLKTLVKTLFLKQSLFTCMLDTKLNDIKYAIFYDNIEAMKVITLKMNLASLQRDIASHQSKWLSSKNPK